MLLLIGYLLLASLATAITAAVLTPDETGLGGSTIGDVPFLTAIVAGFGGLLCLPGTVAWLVVVWKIPRRWRPLPRRAVAIASAPIIGVLVIAYLWSTWGAAFLFGLLLPLGAGVIVRLPTAGDA